MQRKIVVTIQRRKEAQKPTPKVEEGDKGVILNFVDRPIPIAFWEGPDVCRLSIIIRKMANEHINDLSFQNTLATLDHVTSEARNNLTDDPRSNLHRRSDQQNTGNWLMNWISTSTLKALEYGAVSFHMGNYVIDRHTGERTFEPMSIYVRLGMHLLYYGSQQQKVLQWKSTEKFLRDQSVKMGLTYDSPESIAHIEPFIESFNLRSSLHEMKEPDPSRFKTFNEFFSREIRPEARPVDEPDSKLVSSSPADCRLTAYPTIDLATRYWIKGIVFSLKSLLGDEDLANYFEGGSIVIARLAPQDYHRWHAPDSGTVKSVKNIPGDYYTVNPQAINEPGTLDVFCENRRSIMLFERAHTKANIAIIAVGAMLVGSVKYVPGMDRESSAFERGQCLGYFQYGGSTVIVLYPKGELIVDADLVANSTEKRCETFVKVGWRIGQKLE